MAAAIILEHLGGLGTAAAVNSTECWDGGFALSQTCCKAGWGRWVSDALEATLESTG